MKRILLLFTILLLATNLHAQSSSKVNQKEVLEVFVNKKGKVYVNGKKTNSKDLEKKLATLQEKNGVVHYFRAKVDKKSVTEKHALIMDLVKKYKRPTSFFTDKNFTTKIIW